MSTPPKPPKTVNRLQQLITEWERESGQAVRRVNLRVASMMLAGADHDLPRLARSIHHYASGLDMPITDLDEAVDVIHALIRAIDAS